MKLLFTIIFRLVTSIWSIYLLYQLIALPKLVTFFALIIAVTPLLEYNYYRFFSNAGALSMKAPIAMAVLGISIGGCLLTTDAHYYLVVPSLFCLLGFVMLFKWSNEVTYTQPAVSKGGLYDEFKGRRLWFCLGPSNPYDWPLYRCFQKHSEDIMVCNQALDWHADNVIDGEKGLLLREQFKLNSYPQGGAAILTFDRDGRLVKSDRVPSRRARAQLIALVN